MLERQREGIREAAAEGRYKGRVPAARRKTAEAVKLVAEGVARAEVARRLSVSRASVYRITPNAKGTLGPCGAPRSHPCDRQWPAFHPLGNRLSASLQTMLNVPCHWGYELFSNRVPAA